MEINSTLGKLSGLMILVLIVGISACSEGPLKEQESVRFNANVTDTVPNLDLTNSVQIRWTEHGIPHVRANSCQRVDDEGSAERA